jgi:hypothetical protein
LLGFCFYIYFIKLGRVKWTKYRLYFCLRMYELTDTESIWGLDKNLRISLDPKATPAIRCFILSAHVLRNSIQGIPRPLCMNRLPGEYSPCA